MTFQGYPVARPGSLQPIREILRPSALTVHTIHDTLETRLQIIPRSWRPLTRRGQRMIDSKKVCRNIIIMPSTRSFLVLSNSRYQAKAQRPSFDVLNRHMENGGSSPKPLLRSHQRSSSAPPYPGVFRNYNVFPFHVRIASLFICGRPTHNWLVLVNILGVGNWVRG